MKLTDQDIKRILRSGLFTEADREAIMAESDKLGYSHETIKDVACAMITAAAKASPEATGPANTLLACCMIMSVLISQRTDTLVEAGDQLKAAMRVIDQYLKTSFSKIRYG